MKIDLTRQSENNLTHSLAKKIESLGYNTYLEYYMKGNDCRNARFDLVVYDNNYNVKAVIELKRGKYESRLIQVTEENSAFLSKQLERYFAYLKKENVKLFLVKSNEQEIDKIFDILKNML